MTDRPRPPLKVLIYGLYLTSSKNYLRASLNDEYNLDYGVSQAFAHLVRAMRQEGKALKRLDNLLINKRAHFDTAFFDISEAYNRIRDIAGDEYPARGEVRSIMRLLGRAHKEFGRNLIALGFRTPTDPDYVEVMKYLGWLGGGGGR